MVDVQLDFDAGSRRDPADQAGLASVTAAMVSKGVAVEKIRVDLDTEKRGEMMQLTGRRTVPQIFVGETHVGGYDDLAALDQAGKLDELLRS